MFYLAIIQELSSGTVKALYDYATFDEARSVLYSTMASSMSGADVNSVVCMIFNKNGEYLKYERWDRNFEVTETV